ncbi:MAG: M48 family metallopeptidase [Bryobacteraceae bacterium]
MRKRTTLFATALAVLLTACPAARQPGQPLTPGFNLFSPQQDVELGREAAAQVSGQVDVVSDPALQNYVRTIGQRLAAQPGAGNFPYTFTLVNDSSINAFALPGGPIFLHTGLIANAENEAQVAGVIAHEISHVALRHGTSQVSRAYVAQLPAVLAGVTVGGTMLGQLAQLGVGLSTTGLLLSYSRSAEAEADALGARIMADAGYNPIEMARFFERLEVAGAPRAPEFLSTHPRPGNRIRMVQAEIQAMPPRQFTAGTGQFQRMQQLVAQLPPPRRPAVAGVR